MRKTACWLLAGILFAGCTDGKAGQTGASAAAEGPAPASTSFGVRGAAPPSDPIEDAIKRALGARGAAGGKTPPWTLGPDLAAGGKISETFRRSARAVDIAPTETDDALPHTPPPRSAAVIKGIPEHEVAEPAQPSPPWPPPSYADYRLSVGDVIDIIVSGDTELSGRALVRQDGMAALPGALVLVHAAGRTLAEFTEDVRTSLYGNYLKRLPKVSVDVLEGPGFAVTGVIGGTRFVRIPLSGQIRTLKAVLIALVSLMDEPDNYDLGNVTVLEPSRTYSIDARIAVRETATTGYLPPGTVVMIPKAGKNTPGATMSAQPSAPAAVKPQPGAAAAPARRSTEYPRPIVAESAERFSSKTAREP